MAVYDPESDKPSQPVVGDDDIAQKEAATANSDRAGYEDPFTGADKERDFFKNEANDKHNASVGGLKGKLVKFGSKKILAGGIGAGLAGIFIVIGSFMGFLNVFKLNHIMQNIEAKAFSRYQVAMDGRSDRWLRSYIILRLSEITDMSSNTFDEKNVALFRAGGVDTDSPLTDWYRTLRTSSFEKDLLNDYGIRFVSVAETNATGTTFRGGMIKVGDKQIDIKGTDMDLAHINFNGLDPKSVEILKNNLNDFTVTKFESDKDARKAIKTAVNEKTREWQVIKRRHVRKNIQNLIGVRNWRFFEKTRNAIFEKKIAIRNKIIMAALPENTKTGKIIQCLFGITSCKASRDTMSQENRITTTSDPAKPSGVNKVDPNTGSPAIDPATKEVIKQEADNTAETAVDAATKKALDGTADELAVAGIRTSTIKNILAKFNVATAVIGIIDTLYRIDQMFVDGSIIKMVTVARGTQAAGLYATYQTAADQLKTGEVNGEEVNGFMQTLGSVSNSEGWATVIDPPSNSAQAQAEDQTLVAAKNREEYCSEEYQLAMQDPANYEAAENQFHYLCGDKQIGGPTTAETITTWWNSTIGWVLRPVFDAYKKLPLKSVLGWVSDAIGTVTGPIINGVLKVTGLSDSVDGLLKWATVETASALGAGPMMNGTEASGVYMNMLTQGGAYTAESSARSQGASLTTDASRALAQQQLIAYNGEQSKNQSIFSKYLSLENPKSTLSQGLFASVESGTVNNFASSFSQFVKSVARIPLNLFSKPASAATSDGYAAANFAGIETYDFPPECYDLDPLTMKPEDVTNANTVLAANGMEAFAGDDKLTWSLVNDNVAFYNALYAKIGDVDAPDDIATQVYNCAAMDTTVRGGLGYVYGYTADNGLETGGGTTTAITFQNNAVYYLGDSIGEMAKSQIQTALTANNWNPTVESKASRQLVGTGEATDDLSGTAIVERDKEIIKKAGVIIIELGTNDCTSSITDDSTTLYNDLIAINSTAKYYWVDYAFYGNASGTCTETRMHQRNQDLGDFIANGNKNISVIAWSSIGLPYLSGDAMGLHPNAAGQAALAKLIADALGKCSSGSCAGLVLEKATSVHGGSEVTDGHDQYLLPESGPGYYTDAGSRAQDSQWGSKELVETIYQVGIKWAQLHPDGPKFGIGDLDQSVGHVSHVKGVNADIIGCPFFYACPDYDVNLSTELGKLFIEAGNMQSILYNDPVVINAVTSFAKQNNLSGYMTYHDNHWNHFHISVKKGQAPQGCE